MKRSAGSRVGDVRPRRRAPQPSALRRPALRGVWRESIPKAMPLITARPAEASSPAKRCGDLEPIRAGATGADHGDRRPRSQQAEPLAGADGRTALAVRSPRAAPAPGPIGVMATGGPAARRPELRPQRRNPQFGGGQGGRGSADGAPERCVIERQDVARTCPASAVHGPGHMRGQIAQQQSAPQTLLAGH